MLPPLHHRLIIAAALVAATVIWLLLATPLMAVDGHSGLTLTSARVSAPVAVALVVGVAGVVGLLAALTASAGNPLSGVFVFSGALTVLAGVGGPIDGWMRRLGHPADFIWLAGETAGWAVIVAAVVTLIDRLRPGLQSLLPGWLAGPPTDQGVETGTVLSWDIRGLYSCLVCAGVSAILCGLFIRNSSSGQVIGSLVTAFCIGSVVAQSVFPSAKLWGVLLSPFVVGVATYTYVGLTFNSVPAVLAAWYQQSLPSVALALPIYYGSAALVGCVVGAGLAQRFEASMPGHAIVPDKAS